MAFRLGLTGGPNTGKTFSWKFFDQGQRVFAICPSNKMVHLIQNGDTRKEQEIEITSPSRNKNTTKEMMAAFKVNTRAQLMSTLSIFIQSGKVNPEELVIEGNFVYCSDIRYLGECKRFVTLAMPNIDILLTTDFTHYISTILTTKAFRMRKKGGEAFARFWDLAADSLINVLLIADELPGHIIDVTEFHAGDYDETTGTLNVYVPAGNMLKDKFMPKSYFDMMLYTRVLDHKPGQPQKDRYKFVVIPVDHYDGRSLGLFDNVMDTDGQIPNDMGLVMGTLDAFLQHRK